MPAHHRIGPLGGGIRRLVGQVRGQAIRALYEWKEFGILLLAMVISAGVLLGSAGSVW